MGKFYGRTVGCENGAEIFFGNDPATARNAEQYYTDRVPDRNGESRQKIGFFVSAAEASFFHNKITTGIL